MHHKYIPITATFTFTILLQSDTLDVIGIVKYVKSHSHLFVY